LKKLKEKYDKKYKKVIFTKKVNKILTCKANEKAETYINIDKNAVKI